MHEFISGYVEAGRHFRFRKFSYIATNATLIGPIYYYEACGGILLIKLIYEFYDMMLILCILFKFCVFSMLLYILVFHYQLM